LPSDNVGEGVKTHPESLGFNNVLRLVGFRQRQYFGADPCDIEANGVQETAFPETTFRFAQKHALFVGCDNPSSLGGKREGGGFARTQDLQELAVKLQLLCGLDRDPFHDTGIKRPFKSVLLNFVCDFRYYLMGHHETKRDRLTEQRQVPSMDEVDQETRIGDDDLGRSSRWHALHRRQKRFGCFLVIEAQVQNNILDFRRFNAETCR
jgi:hypothetical protein